MRSRPPGTSELLDIGDELYLRDSLRFYGPGVVQVPIGWTPDGPPESWPEQFPEGSRVVFEVRVENAAQAAALAERLRRVRPA